jgi:molybdopterin synthase sulfur carrier subunit
MAVKVRIPTPLQRLTQGKEEVEGATGTIISLVNDLDRKYPGLAERVSENGKIRRFVNIYLNDEDIRFLKAEESRSYLPSLAGADRRPIMKTRVKLTFPQHLIKEPVIFTMARQFNVIPNIRRARVTETVGEMVLELEGDDRDLESGINYLKERGVDVELVEGDVIE